MNILKTNWRAFFKASTPLAILIAVGTFLSFVPEAVDYFILGASLTLLLYISRERYKELKKRDTMM